MRCKCVGILELRIVIRVFIELRVVEMVIALLRFDLLVKDWSILIALVYSIDFIFIGLKIFCWIIIIYKFRTLILKLLILVWIEQTIIQWKSLKRSRGLSCGALVLTIYNFSLLNKIFLLLNWFIVKKGNIILMMMNYILIIKNR